jgi:hypothetical protein
MSEALKRAANLRVNLEKMVFCSDFSKYGY